MKLWEKIELVTSIILILLLIAGLAFFKVILSVGRRVF